MPHMCPSYGSNWRMEVEITSAKSEKRGSLYSLESQCSSSKGTYIRALARDIGEVLQSGAHLTELIRSRAACHLA